MEELVSIIIPVYNKKDTIRETIESILSQTYKNYEIIIIDDNSNDDTMSILLQYLDNIVLIHHMENMGVSYSRNEGIAEAKGKYIAFIDADDVWVKDKLTKQVEFIKKNKYAFTYTGYQFLKRNRRLKKVMVPTHITYEEALGNTTIFTSTVMFNLNILTKKDIKFPKVASEDTACWWKVLKKVDAYGINEVLSFYRVGLCSLSSNKFKAITRTWYLYKYEHLPLSTSMGYFMKYIYHAIRRRI